VTAQHPLVIIGADARAQAARSALQSAGVTGVAMLDKPILRSVFDEGTDTWALHTAAGEVVQARVVVDARRPPALPWTPKLRGHKGFRGVSFHAAAWDPGFDPSGKHIAVVGTDAAAAHHLGRLARAAASVTVFAHAPRRVVSEVPTWSTRAKGRLHRHSRPGAAHPRVAIAATAIEALTASGLRTSDGVDHRADAIIYGTGFFIPQDVADEALVGAAGLPIRRAWHDGMEPFCGVAVRGFPNYFFITGPDPDAQARYVAECLNVMARTASGRIEVRASSQQVFNERAQLRPAAPPPVASAFDLSASAPAGDDTYDGAATLEIAGTGHPVRVRLTGHLDPIDGHYHWQGTVFGSASGPLSADLVKQARTGTLTVGRCSAPARIVEQTPWGTHSVAGVGAPPFALTNR
jgi:cation diffusion facilitator CzcD-associated flavoprotein CzcO